MKFRSAADLAKHLGVSAQIISIWTKKGMPFAQQGFSYHYDLKEVLEWLKAYSPRHNRFVDQILNKEN